MTILVTGATGRVGRHVVDQLVKRDAPARVLSRDSSKADFPDRVEVAQGDLLDLDALRSAMSDVSTLFLLNAVTGDEFTQAIVTLNVAREMGIDRIVYLSVFDAEGAVNVPHFAVKRGTERMLEQMDFGATILRPTYFIDNEAMVKDVIVNHGIYPMPIGGKGVAMVNASDIGEVAAIELVRRHDADGPLPIETINVVGPENLTGERVAAIWSEVLGRQVAYGGDDPSGFEQNMSGFMPAWQAYEMRLMAERYVSHGMIPEAGDTDRLTAMLGRPLHQYRETAEALAAA
ncbi:NmrA family NAD(P)-binding protein [Qipengyuania sp. GH25]|uniref:NmrA family NAD(P)-binding protein n=1 Tax=Qipengyuania pacifica TaxID=2860199 RepID=A0ABS7JHR7_9SPHN|nr:NmrA family NAD(P)-binding protein [Qipengyuania aerophila]MBX7489567.1 NmrA family NAD(P)-binding protein [Qipengyuania aerophila]